MTTHPTGDAPAASERVVEAVARALCRDLYSDNTDDCEAQVNAFWTEEIRPARAAIEAYQKAMRE